ncbi:arsenosugar biosynthesis radical SAM protein ArsS [PVC group bacterium]|nr:arsenosugar biosynthesis radical SAM protein ArsS [PVC group bacterium]
MVYKFFEKLQKENITLEKSRMDILQVNLGKLCNLTCVHCHVEAGPTKTKENMNKDTAEEIIHLMDRFSFSTLDLTGGAPEMNPFFRMLVSAAYQRGLHVIDRCNLTILLEPGYEDLADFLAESRVEVIASLPCYSKDNVEKQRGRGVFGKSIEALLMLNRIGYGQETSGLILNLVYNPVGPHLPPAQKGLESDFRARLKDDFGIVFNKLYAITNMPITRYAKYLKAMKQYDDYVELLYQNFNIHTLEDLMCKNMLNVGWDGKIYDCDFNQMLEMQMHNGAPMTIFGLDPDKLEGMRILMGDHCFGCTAGAGSSCQGALSHS